MAETVYALKDPRTGVIRYVGRTSKPVPTRVRLHMNEASHFRNRRQRDLDNAKNRWLVELIEAGLRPVAIELLRGVDDREEAAEWEYTVMRIAERHGAALTNARRDTQENQVAKMRAFPGTTGEESGR